MGSKVGDMYMSNALVTTFYDLFYNFLRSQVFIGLHHFHIIHYSFFFFLFLVKFITKEMEYKFYNSVQLSTIQNKTKPYSSTGQQTLFHAAQSVQIAALILIKEELRIN